MKTKFEKPLKLLSSVLILNFTGDPIIFIRFKSRLYSATSPNISKELNINLYIKRDDCTALAFGGNKTRHLEFIMAKILKGDYDCILTGAASQSNFCRQAVAAANKLFPNNFTSGFRIVSDASMVSVIKSPPFARLWLSLLVESRTSSKTGAFPSS